MKFFIRSISLRSFVCLVGLAAACFLLSPVLALEEPPSETDSVNNNFPSLTNLEDAIRRPQKVDRPSSDTSRIVIRGATIWTASETGQIVNGAIVIRDQSVEWVGPVDQMPAFDDARVIDARNKFVIPGLIDAHVHLFDASQLPIYLANGVTTVFNMTGTPRIQNWAAQIRNSSRVGPTIYTTGPQIKDEPLPVYDGIMAVDSPADADQLIAAHIEMGYSMIKIWSSLRPDIYDAIVDEAKSNGLRVTGHVPSRVGLKGALASGQESIAHIEELTNKFFNRQLDREGIVSAARILAEYETPVITTLITYEMIVQTADDALLANRLTRPEMRYFDPILHELWKPENNEYRNLKDRSDQFAKAGAFHKDMIKGLHEAGVGLMAGTDAGLFMPTILPGFSIHRELELLVESGLSPKAALRAATAAPGAYLDPGTGRGQIRVGAPADLIVLDKSPWESIGNTRLIHAVVMSGTVLSRADLDAILEETADRQKQAGSFVDRLIAGDVGQAVKDALAASAQGDPGPVPGEEGLLTAAYLFAKRKELENAGQLVGLARKLYPDSYLPVFFQAGFFAMAGQSENEQEALREVLRLVPHHAQAHMRLK